MLKHELNENSSKLTTKTNIDKLNFTSDPGANLNWLNVKMVVHGSSNILAAPLHGPRGRQWCLANLSFVCAMRTGLKGRRTSVFRQ